jgi:hypothetical protein
MSYRHLSLGVVLTLAASSAAVFACSSSGDRSGFGDGSSGGTNGDNGGTFGSGGEAGAPGKVCAPNPANYDIPGNNCDDDGDGTIDNPPACDDALSETGDAEDFAKAIGICTKASDKGYGLVSATFTRGYDRNDAPKDQQHGILPKFGNVIKAREGKKLGVLSTGYAQEYDGKPGEPFGGEKDDGFNGIQYGKDWYNYGPGSPNKQGNGTAPPGFPKGATGCPNATQANDVINLKLTLKAPPNSSGVKFDFNFFSGEWPAYICSAFNDSFIAYLTAKGFNGGKPDNISFDKDKNPVSVNNGFFDRCTPGVEIGCAGGKTATSQCPGGANELAGTGFGIVDQWCAAYDPFGNGGAQSVNGGATGWLTSQAPVQGGEEFTLEFMIWDTGDGILDSSVLIDNFTWAEGEVTTATDRPPR